MYKGCSNGFIIGQGDCICPNHSTWLYQLCLLVKCHGYIIRLKKKKKKFGPNGHIFSPNFGIKALFSSIWVPLLSAQKKTAAFGLKPSHAKQHILGGKNQTLNSTLKVSSVQDKKQCDPEVAAAKGKTTWGKWAMEQ